MPIWLTTAEAMAHLKVSRSTLFRLVREGKVRKYVLPGVADPRYKQEELDALFSPVVILIPGFTERIDDGHALVYTPMLDQPAWSITTLPPAGVTVGNGKWLPGFRYETDVNAEPEEQLAAAKQAARQFLGLEQPAE